MQTDGAQYYLDDPLFPSLATAADGQRMARHFQPLLTASAQWQITACRLERLRYRRATRCLLHYELHLRRGDDAAEQVVWLMGYLHADKQKSQSRQRRLHALAAARDPHALLPRFAVLDELGMLVARFPNDYGLPGLGSIAADLPRLLEPHRAAVFGTETWRLLDVTLEPVRWRAGLAAVMRARVRGAHPNGQLTERVLYVKVHAPQRTACTAAIDMAAPTLPFNVAATLFRDHASGIEVQHAADGVPLLALLQQQRAGRGEATRLAEVLAEWQLRGRAIGRRPLPDESAASMARVAQTLGAATPYLVGSVLAVLNDVRQHWRDGVRVPAHLDLKPDHILFTADTVTLIDLDSAADADPALELARLLARLRYAQVLYQAPDAHAQQFVAHVLARYCQQVPRHWLDNLPCCYAWSLLKIATSMFEHQRPGWTDWVGRLVDDAAAIDLASPTVLTRLLTTVTEPTSSPPIDRIAMEVRT